MFLIIPSFWIYTHQSCPHHLGMKGSDTNLQHIIRYFLVRFKVLPINLFRTFYSISGPISCGGWFWNRKQGECSIIGIKTGVIQIFESGPNVWLQGERLLLGSQIGRSNNTCFHFNFTRTPWSMCGKFSWLMLHSY